MGQRLLITEDEKKRILNLYEQGEISTDTEPNDENLIQFLKDHNIGTRIMYPPINQQNAYAIQGSFPVSEFIGDNGLWLPSAAQLTDEEIFYISEKIIEFYKCK